MCIISEMTDFPENVLLTGSKNISLAKYRLVTSLYRKRLHAGHCACSVIFEIGRERLGGATFTRLSGKQIKLPRGHSFNGETYLYHLLP